jgi:hypothetical protein
MGLLVCLVILGGAWGAGNWTVADLFTVSTADAVGQIDALLSPTDRHASEAEARAALRASYGISPALAARVTGETVQIDPWEAAVAWAYPQMRWDPVPVFQTCNAHTTRLDVWTRLSWLARVRQAMSCARTRRWTDTTHASSRRATC